MKTEIKIKEQDKLDFLSPTNWVFHDDIVEKVLEGDYMNIKPYCAEFVPTTNCSNRCPSCSYELIKKLTGVWERNDFKDPESHMQSVDFAKEMLDKIIDEGVKGIIFTGGGEPFLFRGLEDLVAHVTKRNCDSVIYTNGNAVSEARIYKTLEASPKLVRVSLNCGTDEVYDLFHQPLAKGALNRTLRTIETLARGSLNKEETKIGVGVIMNEVNKGDLVETGKRIREIVDKTGGGIDFVMYRPCFDNYTDNQLTKDLLDEAYETVEIGVKGILKDTDVNVINVKCRYDALKENTRNYGECRGTGLYAEVGPSGKLYNCCDRNLNPKYELGDLTKNSFSEIWQSGNRDKVLDYVNSRSCIMCPPGCKPHETNIQFKQIENLRQKGKIGEVERKLRKHAKSQKPKMVNF